jgi:FkbM family methyltransferase
MIPAQEGEVAGLMKRFRKPKRKKRDTGDRATEVATALNELSDAKQLLVMEAWKGIELEIEHGVKIEARSKKERNRFTRPKHPQMIDWLAGFGSDDVFYDVGANCGSLTLLAGALHRGRVRLVPIEPGYANFESLVRHLSLNEMFGSSIPIQAAVLDRTGLEPMNYWQSTGAGTSLHAVGEPVDQGGAEFMPVEAPLVPTYTMDDLISILELPEPTRVKIDVDGTEERVLLGARETLARGTIRDLVIEVVDHDRHGTRLEAVRALLDRAGYRLAETFEHSSGYVADHMFRRWGVDSESPRSASEDVAAVAP